MSAAVITVEDAPVTMVPVTMPEATVAGVLSAGATGGGVTCRAAGVAAVVAAGLGRACGSRSRAGLLGTLVLRRLEVGLTSMVSSEMEAAGV
jgi:hypothetical protein